MVPVQPSTAERTAIAPRVKAPGRILGSPARARGNQPMSSRISLSIPGESHDDPRLQPRRSKTEPVERARETSVRGRLETSPLNRNSPCSSAGRLHPHQSPRSTASSSSASSRAEAYAPPKVRSASSLRLCSSTSFSSMGMRSRVRASPGSLRASKEPTPHHVDYSCVASRGSGPSPGVEVATLLWAIAAIFVIMWILVSRSRSHWAVFIHLLLALAIIAVLFRVIMGHRAV